MNQTFKFVTLTLSAIILSACGGGGSDSVAEEEPLTPYTSFGSDQNQGRTISTAIGADGDISAIIDEFNEPDFQLVAGLAAMGVDNVNRAETFTFDCPNGDNAKVTFFENYANAVEEVSAVVNGRRISCKTTYPAGSYPSTIGSSASISDLILAWDVSDSGEYISTDCPDESSPDFDLIQDLEPNPSICETGYVMDATVTDDEGNKHLVSFESISVPD